MVRMSRMRTDREGRGGRAERSGGVLPVPWRHRGGALPRALGARPARAPFVLVNAPGRAPTSERRVPQTARFGARGRVRAACAGHRVFGGRPRQRRAHDSAARAPDGIVPGFNFPDKVVSFFSGSTMEENFVLPYVGNYGIPVVELKRTTSWQKEVLDALLKMEILFKRRREKRQAVGREEYQIAIKIVEIWYMMICNIEKSGKKISNSYIRKQERIQAMLSYIHNQYMHPMCLADIAQAGNVSVGECCRGFKEVVCKSPNEYLTEYRILRSKELLRGTELSVTEVSGAVGFNSVSHFIQCFKKMTGVTPKAYKNMKC